MGVGVAFVVVLWPAAVASPLTGAGPIVAGVTPNTVTRGDVDDVLVITGSNFDPNAVVSFCCPADMTVISTAIDSDTQITVHVSVPDNAFAGWPVSLVVTNPDGQHEGASVFVNVRNGPAVFRDGVWFVRHTFSTGIADATFGFGDPGDQPLDCPNGSYPNGSPELDPTVYRTGAFFGVGYFGSWGPYRFGDPGDVGLCGRWGPSFAYFNSGVFRPSTAVFYLRGANPVHAQFGDIVVAIPFGNPYDTPVMGDWDGDGITNLGVVRNGVWYLDTHNDPTAVNGRAAIRLRFGNRGDIPVVGDWDGDGKDSPGVVRNGVWYTRNELTTGIADASFSYGNPNDIPLFFAT